MNIIGRRYLSDEYTVVLLGDDIYSRQPLCQQTLDCQYSFIYVCKTSSHKYLYEWINEFSPSDLHEITDREWTGKERLYYRYRYKNDVPLKDGSDAMLVNWLELTIFDKHDKVRKQFSFVTDIKIINQNIRSLIAYGRSRWKIENGNNNILKTKGYHLEHNFGHGSKNLSNFLMTLNLITFLFHTVLGFYDRQYLLLRKTLPSRKIFFHDVKSLTKYFCFKNWNDLLKFMIKGLEIEDPGG